MGRGRNWEYRLTTYLLNRRLLLLPIAVGLQLLLILALATLFWLTKVKDRFPAQGSLQGQTQTVIQCGTDGLPTVLFIEEGELVSPGQPLARLASGAVITAPMAGMAWGAAFEKQQSAADLAKSPCLSILDPASLACKLEIRNQDRAKVALGSQVRLDLQAPDLEVTSPLLGRVIEIEAGSPTIVIVSLQPLPSADIWAPLGQLLTAEEKVMVTVETRTRRLLGLLFRR